MRAYAEGGLHADIKGLPQYERKLDELVEEVLDAAEKNGYNRKTVFKQGLAATRTYYYGRFFEAINKEDQKSANDYAEFVIRVGAKYSNLRQSVETRLETQGQKRPNVKQSQTLSEAWRTGMKRAGAKRDPLR